MTFVRKIWKESFAEWREFPCPSCESGFLQIDKKSICVKETVRSKKRGNKKDREGARFSGRLKCNQSSCGEFVFVCGNAIIIYRKPDRRKKEVRRRRTMKYCPRYFESAPPIISIPSGCSARVRGQIEIAYSLFWVNHDACVNRLRVALELLLDDLKIGKGEQNKNGKQPVLTLHKKIEFFEERYPDASKEVMALKLLGNFASHGDSGSLKRKDALDVFEFLQHALEVVYVENSKNLQKRAENIIKKKGPAR